LHINDRDNGGCDDHDYVVDCVDGVDDNDDNDVDDDDHDDY
jgi:hypothetical protein